VVASTDLLHDADWERVAKTDRVTLQQIAALQTERLNAAWSAGQQVCCGIGPVLTAMAFAQGMGVRQGEVLKYRNSGDDFPDSRGNWVVGYGAVAFVGPDSKHP
jgi:AmmeMemoRadiSam system protein B